MIQTPASEPENLPLPGACPPWCSQHPGHPWTSLTAVFCARDHVAEIGGLMLGGTLVHAAVIASESCDLGTGQAIIEPAKVIIDLDAIQPTQHIEGDPDQIRWLVRVLTAAADKVDQLDPTEQEVA